MKFLIYEDEAGESRWRLVTPNGNIVADSGEGYKNLLDCEDVIDSIKAHVGIAAVEYLDKD